MKYEFRMRLGKLSRVSEPSEFHLMVDYYLTSCIQAFVTISRCAATRLLSFLFPLL